MSGKKGFIIAIDGPVASGKGTIAPQLAKLLGGFYLYSGAVFRCIGLYCLENNIDTRDVETVSEIASLAHIQVTEEHILLNNKDVTERIKKEDAAMAASNVAMFEKVREVMVKVMREIATYMIHNGKIVVTEGRDMATTVFPQAECKFFLTASPEVRAKRRLLQIHKNGDVHVSYENVLSDTITRDEQDKNRQISPLVKDPEKFGYHIIDDSELDESATLDLLVKVLKEQKLYI